MNFCYNTDRLETRGVFRGFFAKNPSGTAFAPFAKRIQHGRTQVTVTPLEGAWTVTNFSHFSAPACFPVLDHQEAEDPKEACSRKTGPEQRCIVIPCSGALPSPRPDMEDRVDGSILEVHQKGVEIGRAHV